MLAAFIRKTGTPDVIEFAQLPDPSCGSSEVIVEVRAVAVNPIDTYIRSGSSPADLPNPFVIGCDLAGVVVEAGKNVTNFRIGDRVWGSNQGLLGRQGTFSTLAAVDEKWLYSLPAEVSFETAAASALVGITAHLGLFREAELHSNETLFIRGGSGGVGSMVIQMARIIGATIITTARTPDKMKRCQALGASIVIDYKKEDVAKRLAEVSPQGVDVFWELLREPDLTQAVTAIKERGTIILMAGRTAKPTLPLGPFYVKECRMRGFVMFKASPEEQLNSATQISNWLKEGKLIPQIDRILPLSSAAEAHRIQESSTVGGSSELTGKIVLVP